MSSAPILTFVPKVDVPDEAPDWMKRAFSEIQNKAVLVHQKLNNHAQAFGLQQQQLASIKAGGTTTNIVSGGGGSSGGGSASPFIGQGLINDQTGQTSYSTVPGDNGILLILNDASPVAVTLTTTGTPFYLFVTNFGAGTVTLTPSTGLINGGASLSLLQNQSVLAECDSTNWKTTAVPVPPVNTPAVTHKWLDSYDAATGLFGQTQPDFTDITGRISNAQLPASGLSVTIVTAALTTLGTQGSQTFVNGILTAQVQAT